MSEIDETPEHPEVVSQELAVATPQRSGGLSFFRRHRTATIATCATALALIIGGSGVAVGASISAQQAAVQQALADQQAQAQQYEAAPSNFQASTLNTTPATDTQKVGVVTILTDLYYDSGSQAAGTGMILTSSGEILTNNHVVQGATTIEVTVESTGKTYTANVVGTDSVDDIAVLQLVDASGLDTVDLSSSAVATGNDVTSIGNAEGTGDLVAAEGAVLDTDQSITVSNDLTGEPEALAGLIEVDADVVSGDSGGPLVNSDGVVVGIVTAASSGSRNITGYAIPIATALRIVHQIEAGSESGNVIIGLPAFLGVSLAKDATDATVAGTVDGSPAASAGLVAGDVITAVDGTAVSTQTELSTLIKSYDVGTQVTVSFTDATGAAQSVTVTLTAGPAA